MRFGASRLTTVLVLLACGACKHPVKPDVVDAGPTLGDAAASTVVDAGALATADAGAETPVAVPCNKDKSSAF
ncbi:MAG TPA: hypothetical protein VF407_18580, partial [Polyangiaceae bacterium]